MSDAASLVIVLAMVMVSDDCEKAIFEKESSGRSPKFRIFFNLFS